MNDLIIIALVSLFQESAFTWSSRSRNSGDSSHHFWAVCTSTMMFFIMQVFIMKTIWQSIETKDMGMILLTGFVFTLCSAIGSSITMHFLLKYEKGNKKVGANPFNKN